MNIGKIDEYELGYNITIVTISGNKIQGEVLKSDEGSDFIKLKTQKGIVIVNSTAIESIY